MGKQTRDKSRDKSRDQTKDRAKDNLKHITKPDGSFVIQLTYDVPFKYVFGQQGESEALLMRFLNDILKLKGEREIIELTYANVEVPPVMIDGRRLVLDLRVTDQRGVTYNIELQRQNSGSILKRAIFQQSRITGGQLNVNQSFNDITPVYVVLICNYSTFPDGKAVRAFQATPFDLDDLDDRMSPLPSRPEHFAQALEELRAHASGDSSDDSSGDSSDDFDLESAARYHHLKSRLEAANEAIELVRHYLIELDKHLRGLTPDQTAWIKYLTTNFTFSSGGDDMNQRPPKAQRYKIPPNVSEETRAQLERAQERLDFFASRPEHRDAYEQEVLNMMTHNTDLEDSFDVGAAVGEERGIAIGEERGIAIGEERGIAIGEERGIAIGEERGIAIGEERGIAIGEERGIAIGEEKWRRAEREEGRLAMIKKFRDKGFDDDMIADLLDLTPGDREALLGER